MWRCLSRKKIDFLKASCNTAIARAFIVPMIVLFQFVTVTWGLEWRQIDGVHTPEKILYKVLGRAPVCKCRWWSKQTVSHLVWGCYHLAQFFHQYLSVTQPYCIPHDISQVQSRLMDLFGRLDKCIPRTRKGVSLISRGMRLLCLTVPQILQQVLSIFVRSFATPCRRLAGRSHWLLLWNAVRYC
jgi:hypothetical protein